jgi:hypothetical protein
MPASSDQRAKDRLKELRQTRQSRVERMLHEEMVSLAPGNAAYWIAVVLGSFVVNLLVLMAIAR